ncbi:hypothetical protein HY772_08150 [Candidatus Woesearchaeota archaeon]|nr:hypothetical protein [Candidatus Woesearchaeota archaeon]
MLAICQNTTVEDPIYSFPITSEPWMVMGGGGWYITVNGRPAKYVYVYHPYQQYLAAEIKSTYSLLYSYTPPSQMKPYRVKYLELLVIKGMRQFEHLSTPVAFLNWPSNLLPPKEVLADDNIKAIIIDDKGIDPVLDVFGIPPMKILFTYQQEAYTINTTPLLPHQPHDHPSTIYPQEFDLPFKCP